MKKKIIFLAIVALIVIFSSALILYLLLKKDQKQNFETNDGRCIQAVENPIGVWSPIDNNRVPRPTITFKYNNRFYLEYWDTNQDQYIGDWEFDEKNQLLSLTFSQNKPQDLNIDNLFAIRKNCEAKENTMKIADTEFYRNSSILLGKLEEDDIYGLWEHPGNPEGTVPGLIKFEEDRTFQFTGWLEKDFISNGTWEFNSDNNILSLQFIDRHDYWEDMILQENYEYLPDVALVDPENYTIGIILQDGGPFRQEGLVYLNFFGWSFNHHTN